VSGGRYGAVLPAGVDEAEGEPEGAVLGAGAVTVAGSTIGGNAEGEAVLCAAVLEQAMPLREKSLGAGLDDAHVPLKPTEMPWLVRSLVIVRAFVTVTTLSLCEKAPFHPLVTSCPASKDHFSAHGETVAPRLVTFTSAKKLPPGWFVTTYRTWQAVVSACADIVVAATPAAAARAAPTSAIARVRLLVTT
jgi:hypothetical protein